MPLGGKKFGYAKSIYNFMSVNDRLNLISCTKLNKSDFMEDGGVKGWIQLNNEQKKALIDCLDNLGMLD